MDHDRASECELTPRDPDAETRERLAIKMIQNARVPKQIPEEFDPLCASPEDLRRYGIPPRPNKETHPLYHAKWEEVLSRPLGVIVPKLTTQTKSPRPGYRPNPNRNGVQHNAGSWPWSGAVIGRPTGEFVDSVSASWTVPNVFPPHSAWNSSINNWNDGEWYCSVCTYPRVSSCGLFRIFWPATSFIFFSC